MAIELQTDIKSIKLKEDHPKKRICLVMILAVLSIIFSISHLQITTKIKFFKYSKKEKVIIIPETDSRQNHQKIFKFHHLTFSSEFDSGNLEEIRYLGKNHYSLKLDIDPENPIEPNTYKNWFYFSVKGFKKKKKLTISIHNMKFNWSMWKHGLTPVYRSKISTNNRWKLFNLRPVKIFLKKKKLTLKFTYEFEVHDEVEFALTFPYTSKKLDNYIKKITKKFDEIDGINFQKETLILSNEKKNIELLWITKEEDKSKKDITVEKNLKTPPKTSSENQINKNKPKTYKLKSSKKNNFKKKSKKNQKIKIPKLSDLFPNIKTKETNLTLKKNKCTIILSARVHPAETASSYMLEGYINYLIKHKEETNILLNKCSIGIVPMLNPDGVDLGLTRTDSNGFNLNSIYSDADINHPSIYGFKKLVRFLHKNSKINFFFDLHSHFTKRGVFFFGNPLAKKNYEKILLFPFLFNINEKRFNINNSGFGSEKTDSTSRKDIYEYTKINKIYTIEANYWGNPNLESDDKLKKKKLIKNNLRVVKDFSDFYKISDFRLMGYHLAKSIFGYYNLGKDKKEKKDLLVKVKKFYQSYTHKKKFKKKRKKKILGKTKKNQKKFNS